MYESIPFNTKVIQTKAKSSLMLQARINNEQFVDYQAIPIRNTVTKLDISDEIECRLVSKYPFNYSLPGIEPRYSDKHKIEDFLYEIQYGNIDYEYAKQHFIDTPIGGCSSIRKGNYFGRNFDWLYDNQVQFVVHTPSSFDHYAVLGVSGIIPGINKDTVDQDDIIVEGVDMFKLLPFYLLDGINEKGLFCTHNVVPLDDTDSPTREIKAVKEEKDRICIPMLVRYVLDRFSSAKQAILFLKEHVTLYFSDIMIDTWQYQSHFLIGDSTETYVLEFIKGEMLIYKMNYITNFPITGVQFGKFNFIQYPPTQYGMHKYGMGLERWDEIVMAYRFCDNIGYMRRLLNSIKYSNTYNPLHFWYSELCKYPDDNGQPITVDTPKELCTNAKNQLIEDYNNRDRDNPKVWITCHSSIYNLRNKTLYLVNQENDQGYDFSLC